MSWFSRLFKKEKVNPDFAIPAMGTWNNAENLNVRVVPPNYAKKFNETFDSAFKRAEKKSREMLETFPVTDNEKTPPNYADLAQFKAHEIKSSLKSSRQDIIDDQVNKIKANRKAKTINDKVSKNLSKQMSMSKQIRGLKVGNHVETKKRINSGYYSRKYGIKLSCETVKGGFVYTRVLKFLNEDLEK